MSHSKGMRTSGDHLLFTEGHNAHEGEAPVREELEGGDPAARSHDRGARTRTPAGTRFSRSCCCRQPLGARRMGRAVCVLASRPALGSADDRGRVVTRAAAFGDRTHVSWQAAIAEFTPRSPESKQQDEIHPRSLR